jgi:hypothetical protein
VKRQYLLDERDFRKYALLEDLAETGLFHRMALLWMLTPDDRTGHGQSRSRDLSRPRLSGFFASFEDSQPTFVDVADYFRALGLDVYSHEPLYTTRSASRYFAEIPDRYLDKSIVFFDPDNGLEPAGGATNAHLRLSDIASVWRRRRSESVMVAFQYAARKSHAHLESLRSTLGDRLFAETAAVTAGQVRFFVAGTSMLLADLRSRVPNLGWV